MIIKSRGSQVLNLSLILYPKLSMEEDSSLTIHSI